MLLALSTPDTVVAVACGAVAIWGAFRGFAWLIVALAALIGACWGAFSWNDGVAAWLEENVSFIPGVAAPWIAGFGIFVGLLIVGIWFAWMARGALRKARLGGLDRLLGFVLGAGVGLVLATGGFLFWGSFQSRAALEDKLAGSVSVPYMAKVAKGFEVLLPDRWSDVLQTLDGIGEPSAE